MAENLKNTDILKQEAKLAESTIKINDDKENLFTPKEDEITPNKLDIIEEYLMFNYRPVSAFKLYYYISGKCEIFLMIIAIILTIGAGCSIALKSSL